MKTYNYRINLFNNNYIIITTTAIISKHNEYINNTTDKNAIIWHTLYNSFKKADTIAANSSIAISKDTIEAQIIMNELTEEEKTITIEAIKNACVIATYEGHQYAGPLSYIIIDSEKLPNIKLLQNHKQFQLYYGKEITDYILNNQSIKDYQNQMNGKLPYEYDKHVFLYENGTIKETYLPEYPKTRMRTK